MQKERYQIHEKEVSLNVEEGQITSIRKKDLFKTGCRVYDRQHLGLAGTLGQDTDETWARAEENLSLGILYPFTPATGTRQRELGQPLSAQDFLAQAEQLLAGLRAEFPDFIFSNKLNFTEYSEELQNDAGLSYRNQDTCAALSLLVKSRESIQIFDTFLGSAERSFQAEPLLCAARELLTAHRNPISLPGRKLPVILQQELFDDPFSSALHGQALHRGASLFSGRIGEQIFSERFTLQVDRTDEPLCRSFFDAEGSVLPQDRLALIDHGILLRGFADRRTAREFGVSPTASAAASYNAIPTTSCSCSVAPGTQTLRELLGGEDAILVAEASGGDTTPDGHFATPVQIAYLYHDGQLVGRLPELNLSGDLQTIFGGGYIGCSADRPYFSNHLLVLEAEVSKA